MISVNCICDIAGPWCHHPLLCATSKPVIVNIINLYVTLWQPFHAVKPSAPLCCQVFGAVWFCSLFFFIAPINQHPLTTKRGCCAVEKRGWGGGNSHWLSCILAVLLFLWDVFKGRVGQQFTAHGGEKKGRWLNRGSGSPAYLPAVLSGWDWLDYVIPSNLFFTSSEYRNSSSACPMETAAAPNTLREV